MKSKILTAILCAVGIVGGASAQTTVKEKIYVNPDVTTHIVMPENIRLVDISSTKIVGNQCADNIVRIKPLSPDDMEADSQPFRENELLATLTLIGERHMAQYDVVFVSSPPGPYQSTTCLTAICSLTSTLRCRCRNRRWRVTPGLSMAAVANIIRWCHPSMA